MIQVAPASNIEAEEQRELRMVLPLRGGGVMYHHCHCHFPRYRRMEGMFTDGLASKLESSIVTVTLKLKSEENHTYSVC